MTILEDQLVQKMIMRKDLSDDRINTYATVLNEYCTLTGLNPTQLIQEAKEDQTPYVNDKNQVIFPDADDRKLSFYLEKYNHYLIENGKQKSTRKQYLQAVRAFYREYNIELPKPITINVPRIIIKEGTVPGITDIRKALDFSNNLRNKALILLMATSGIRTVDIQNFKISDFTYATREYHEGDNIYDLLDLKDRYIDNIIPAWFFIPSKTRKKEKNVCLTFNTPECTQILIDYLRSREDLQETDPLFTATGKRMHKATYANIFETLNDNIFQKVDSKGKRFFRAHNLRTFFLSQYRQKTNDPFNLKLVAGHALPGVNDENYQELPVQPSREVYMKVIPSLSIRDTEIHVVKSKEYLKLERENEAKEQRLFELEERDKLRDKREVMMQKQIDNIKRKMK